MQKSVASSKSKEAVETKTMRKKSPESELEVYPVLLQTLLMRRGIFTREKAEEFLHPDYDRDIRDPFGILNMERAVDRILEGIFANEKIVIYGDYDCDGIPGSVVLHDFFKKIAYPNFSNYIPHRHLEGYGLNAPSVEQFAKDGVDLVITVDCGIADVEPVALAQSLGIDVIVTDHHLPQAVLPPAYAIVNSKQAGDTYWDNMLCGAGVAFKLVQGLIKKGEFSAIPPGWEKWLLDMAGLSTIADMVPLRNENRAIAHYGLTVLRKSRRVGLIELLRLAGVDQRHLTEEDVGFTIGPRINAASRMDIPLNAFRLLSSTEPDDARSLAEHLTGLNDTRKKEVALMMREVNAHLKDRELREVIVMGSPKWRIGIVGLAANQIVEKYNRPAFVWGREGGTMIKGSCRSDGTVNVLELMLAVREGIFINRGGHEFSGGFSVEHESIHLLEDELVLAYQRIEKTSLGTTQIDADATLSLHDVNRETYHLVNQLAPFGEGNPRPVFFFPRVTVRLAEQFGKTKNHLRFDLVDDRGDTASAIGFFMDPSTYPNVDLSSGSKVDLYATMELSRFRGKEELRLRVVDVK
jgi:single-stranded-DNA-specific exonuclease